MVTLPDVTLICADCANYGPAMMAIRKTLEQITPARTIFFTDMPLSDSQFEVIQIERLNSAREYSVWMMKELGKYSFKTSHLLVIQHDGYVLNGDQWDPEFLKFDWVGAPWLERDGFNVGNGGFSLRSVRLHQILEADEMVLAHHPEDAGICRVYRDYLERKHHMTWAPEALAHKFSFELHTPWQKTFGFHGDFHHPYKPYVVIKREGAMGDVIQIEPVLRWFHEHDYNVVLDSPFCAFFYGHFFPVIDYSKFDKNVIPHRVINLDLAYEQKPRQLHLKSYFEAAGIEKYTLENPVLNYQISDQNRIFRRYCVLHIDERDTVYRNIFGVDWQRVKRHLEDLGYAVIQIGKGKSEPVGLHFNTVNHAILQWLIAGCNLFVGVDSGPSHVAVALQRKCVIFFGSVNPAFIHADLSKITVMQSPCPIDKAHCWHSVPGTKGVECAVPHQEQEPPCCKFSTASVVEAINKTAPSDI